MNSEFEKYLHEAENWLSVQRADADGYEISLFRKFIEGLRENSAPEAAADGVRVVTRLLVDAGSYQSEQFRAVSAFVERASKLVRAQQAVQLDGRAFGASAS